MCDEFILPKGARVTSLNSHTHPRGVHFWYELPSGEHVYDVGCDDAACDSSR
ncbi:MAG: hypothetical protein P8R42_10025 [Candidatus Binatia bacterium]|nr:hypothetical protein [Candidatus Binatia bacterium]